MLSREQRNRLVKRFFPKVDTSIAKLPILKPLRLSGGDDMGWLLRKMAADIYLKGSK